MIDHFTIKAAPAVSHKETMKQLESGSGITPEHTNMPTSQWLYWHYHKPSPYVVVAELVEYANTLTDPGAQAEYALVIDKITARLGVSASAATA